MTLSKPVQLSTLVLTTIGMFDLVTTMMLMTVGVQEGNPFFANIAQHGSLAFALAKLAFLAGPVMLLEYVRIHRPRSAEQGTWVAACFYAALYVGHLLTTVV